MTTPAQREAVARKLREMFPDRTHYRAETAFNQTDELIAAYDAAAKARPLAEWHENMGDVLWWRFPIDEPPLVSSPISSDWPGYHTHFTMLPTPPKEPADA